MSSPVLSASSVRLLKRSQPESSHHHSWHPYDRLASTQSLGDARKDTKGSILSTGGGMSTASCSSRSLASFCASPSRFSLAPGSSAGFSRVDGSKRTLCLSPAPSSKRQRLCFQGGAGSGADVALPYLLAAHPEVSALQLRSLAASEPRHRRRNCREYEPAEEREEGGEGEEEVEGKEGNKGCFEIDLNLRLGPSPLLADKGQMEVSSHPAAKDAPERIQGHQGRDRAGVAATFSGGAYIDAHILGTHARPSSEVELSTTPGQSYCATASSAARPRAAKLDFSPPDLSSLSGAEGPCNIQRQGLGADPTLTAAGVGPPSLQSWPHVAGPAPTALGCQLSQHDLDTQERLHRALVLGTLISLSAGSLLSLPLSNSAYSLGTMGAQVLPHALSPAEGARTAVTGSSGGGQGVSTRAAVCRSGVTGPTGTAQTLTGGGVGLQAHMIPSGNMATQNGDGSAMVLGSEIGVAAEKAEQRAVHTCQICGKVFQKHQALGGHMRRHRGSKGPREEKV